ncbi:Gfo/Idh/MocA family protein [Streptomyces aidingensis]|uniref:Predicted dehydrogenase n=1 Tax=Streptomyces aidingensis TaxID=910347 RepID=A0A1I1URD7_9ACTN|nr:Gfo/Idh/MocA family oxidoreductase [Streptomyces aidingensis]SFD73155.1 Predicted dehydrogenase [Streptomyces aidingensis]
MHTLRRAAVVGLGTQALEDHLPGVAASRLAELVAVCDTDPGRVAPVESAHQVPGYTDLERLLADVRPDFVIIAVPHHAGRRITETCAKAGVHVMKEKPFATDPAEAADLAVLCRTTGIELMVTVQRRFHPVYRAARQMLEHVGDPYLLEGRYTFRCPDPSAGWRGQAGLAGGGCLIDMGYHLVDLVIWYLGLPDRILAHTSATASPGASYDAEDTALVHLSYDSGLHGSLLVSRSIGPKAEQLRVTGPQGTVVVERGRASRLDPGGRPVESLTREPAWPRAATAQIDHFCRVLDGRCPNPSGPDAHLPHAAFLGAAYASATTGRPMDPKEFL